jgi:diguanylate cyclase (GGDEF)-like protein/PAS domain S-box-containing protein
MTPEPVSILLIDDDEDDFVLTRDLLDEIGSARFRLTWAPAYEAALAALRECSHDVYLLDYHLGEHNGLELLREAVALGCRAPIIMLTGQGDREVDLEAMRLGAADFLSKASLAAPALERAIRYCLERARTLEALRESEERYSLAASGANDGLWDWNLKTGSIYFSPRWKSMLGLAGAEVHGRPEEWFTRVHPEDLARLRSDLTAHLDGATPHFENEHRLMHRDGSFRWMLTRGLAVRGDDGVAYRIAGSQTDTTGRKVHDALTGLPNRVLFLDRLASALARAGRHGGGLVAVLSLDLDRFKLINDSLGHPLGDQLLSEVARRLETCVRPGDTVARLGGDEFAILVEEVRDVRAATRVADRIHETLANPCRLGGHELFTSASIGIALAAGGAASPPRPEALLTDADTAMNRAKASGPARAEVFDEAMRARALQRLQIESDLRWAVDRSQLWLEYQPIVTAADGAIIGLEALARWGRPEHGPVLPEDFIPVAEETGLIAALGDHILRLTCRQVRRWLERLPARSPLVVSVNLSARQLARDDFAREVGQILEETGLPAARLKLELTESALVESAERTAAQLDRLRRMGVGLWLDDFGTGHSSLSYLHRLPLEALKIDRSFVSKLDEEEGRPEITRTIVLLAHSLGLTTIAEGVESAAQRDHLHELGCDHLQGFLFGPPVPAEHAWEHIAPRVA